MSSTLLFQAPAAHAQNLALSGLTPVEKIGFAYYNLTRQSPPVESWVMASDAYMQMSPVDRIPFLDEERQRLRQGFARYMPQRDLITIHFAVNIRGMDNPYLDIHGPPPAPGTPLLNKAITMSIPKVGEDAYFPFKLGGQWIAVIPGGIKVSSLHPLTEEQYTAIAQATGMNEKEDIVAEGELILRPIAADKNRPMVLDSLPMWLMMADVASYALLDRNRQTLWSYTADWYEAGKSVEYMTLFDQ